MKNLTKILLILVVSSFCLADSAGAASLSDRLKGRILLQVEANGEGWYINPVNSQRYFLGRPADAFRVMRELGLGVSNRDFDAMKGYAPTRLSGRILLKVEDKGRAYYANPVDKKLYYLGRPMDAFNLMRSLGLGIKTSDLGTISVAAGYGIPAVPSNSAGQADSTPAGDTPAPADESANDDTSGDNPDTAMPPAEPAITGTAVPADIAQSAAWKKSESPYIVTSDVVIAKNATVTVEPGVKIIFKPGPDGDVYSLIVNGELNAVGTSEDPVYFQGVDDLAKGQSWGGIVVVNGGRATLRFASVSQAEYGVNAPNAANLVVSDSITTYCGTGLRFSGPATIQNNRVLYNNTGLVYTADTASPRDDGSFRLFDRLSTVERNTIKGNGNTASTTEGGLVIEGVKAAGANLTFKFNNVSGNTTGVGFVDTNYFRSLTIEKNDIASSTYYAAAAGKEGTTITLENNYWGTTNPDEIAGKVYDYYDVNESWAVIDYRPYLNASAL